jgi:hypothetical protein
MIRVLLDFNSSDPFFLGRLRVAYLDVRECNYDLSIELSRQEEFFSSLTSLAADPTLFASCVTNLDLDLIRSLKFNTEQPIQMDPGEFIGALESYGRFIEKFTEVRFTIRLKRLTKFIKPILFAMRPNKIIISSRFFQCNVPVGQFYFSQVRDPGRVVHQFCKAAALGNEKLYKIEVFGGNQPYMVHRTCQSETVRLKTQILSILLTAEFSMKKVRVHIIKDAKSETTASEGYTDEVIGNFPKMALFMSLSSTVLFSINWSTSSLWCFLVVQTCSN